MINTCDWCGNQHIKVNILTDFITVGEKHYVCGRGVLYCPVCGAVLTKCDAYTELFDPILPSMITDTTHRLRVGILNELTA